MALSGLSGRPLLGELLPLPAPADAEVLLPSRLGMANVVEIERLTRYLRDRARERGRQAALVRAVADQVTRLRAVPAPE
ncbi:MAG: hypothetical protein M3308_07820, partial [Actinomycetota bacterium]|nr:hypothetical protein [Actinomycetota bacterium]